MRILLQLLFLSLPLIVLAQLGGCSCGFDCNNNSDGSSPASLTLGMSDSTPEDLKQVVIEVDSITFRRSGATPVVVDRFTIPAQNLVDAETFTIDLLQYPGVRQLEVIQNRELATGNYTGVEIKVLDGSISRSYVQLQDDSLREITVTNGVLVLPGMQLVSGTQRFVIEFGLARALQYQSGSDKYLLANTGVRVENVLTAATLSGVVDSALFDGVSPCSEKSNPLVGNRVYLYQGIGLLPENLADVFTSTSTTTVPTNAKAPFAVASMADDIAGNWQYSFGFVPAGDYTLAFACDTQNDDAVNYDGLTIPLPVAQKYEISLSNSERAVCNLAEGASC
ncbi:MAG: DUF4382 domain-containing protein [Halioglobus sp.]